MTEMSDVRVRIAPSPTGDPHVGTAYVALFNMVLAKKTGGKFILRIEDTDRVRARAGSEVMILDSLKWLGVQWDEGPDIGGPYGPYRQSERSEIYREHVNLLINNGSAYPCFCSPEDLEQMRETARQEGRNFGYDRRCRDLSAEHVAKRMQAGDPYVVRLKMPVEGEIAFRDELRGEINIACTQLDDQVLLKTDGFPTYHLANVVDDHLMKITHVMRAEEWISSTPKHVQLYRAFGWQEPTWVHLPLLRNNDRSKISKRKNPVSLNYYRRAGILPAAMVNFLGLMGWSYGDDVEIFDLQSMIEKFEYKDITLGGPIFDQVKLNWINQHYIQRMTEEEFAHHVREEIFSVSYLRSLFPLLKDRMQKFDEFSSRADFFFSGGIDYTGLDLIPKGMEGKDFRKVFEDLLGEFERLDTWDLVSVEQCLSTVKDRFQIKPKDFFMPLRLMVTGRKDSPPLAETIVALGAEIVRFRVRDAVNYTKKS